MKNEGLEIREQSGSQTGSKKRLQNWRRRRSPEAMMVTRRLEGRPHQVSNNETRGHWPNERGPIWMWRGQEIGQDGHHDRECDRSAKSLCC